MKKLAKRFMIKDSGLVVDLVSGRNFTVNATGMVIFKDFVAGRGRDQTLATLGREFGVDRATAERDLDEFLLDLKVLGIDESR